MYFVTSGQFSNVRVEEGENEIVITTAWNKKVILNLIYHEPEGAYEGEIDITIYLNVVTPEEVRDLVFNLYAYHMTPEGLKLILKDDARSGINEVRLRLPYKLASREAERSFIGEPVEKMGAVTFNRTIGERWEFTPVYTPTNVAFYVVRFHREVEKWYLGLCPYL